jgi:hypothetical protein
MRLLTPLYEKDYNEEEYTDEAENDIGDDHPYQFIQTA